MYTTWMPTPEAAQFKAWVCDLSLAAVAGSNPPGAWMTLSCECCVLWGRDLWVGPITRPEESHRLCCVWVWSWSLDNEEVLTHCGLLSHRKKSTSWGNQVTVGLVIVKVNTSTLSGFWARHSYRTGRRHLPRLRAFPGSSRSRPRAVCIVISLRTGWFWVRTTAMAQEFSHLQKDAYRLRDSPRPLVNGYQFCRGVNRPGSEIDHNLLSTAEVKNEWSYNFTPPTCLYGVGMDNFTFAFHTVLRTAGENEINSQHEGLA
jgi:hypothetical protein